MPPRKRNGDPSPEGHRPMGGNVPPEIVEQRIAQVMRLLCAERRKPSEVKRLCSKQWSAPAKDGTPAPYPVSPRAVEHYLCRARKRAKALADMPLRQLCRSAVSHYWGVIQRSETESEARVDRAYRELLLISGGYAPTKHAATDTAGNDLLLSGETIVGLLADEASREHLAGLAEALEQRRAAALLPAPSEHNPSCEQQFSNGQASNGHASTNGHPFSNGNGHSSSGHDRNGDGQ